MASNLYLANALANAQADSMNAQFANGKLRIYSGTQPATADTALSGNTLLAEFTLPATVFGSAAAGVVTANAVTGVNASASGTASFFRCLKSDSSTPLMDGNVGTSNADLNINSTSISSGAAVSITSWTHTVTK